MSHRSNRVSDGPRRTQVKDERRQCPPCRIKAHALMMQHPDNSHVAWLVEVLERGAA